MINVFGLVSHNRARFGTNSEMRENGLDREGTIDMDREPPNKWLTLLTVAMNGFLIILDISIVNISFPTLTRVFNTEPSIVLWVSVVYALVTVGLMLILGRIGEIYGRKKIFILGYILFSKPHSQVFN